MTVPFMYKIGNLIPRALFPPPKAGKIENFRNIYYQIPYDFLKFNLLEFSPQVRLFFVEKGNLTFSDWKMRYKSGSEKLSLS